MSRVNWIGASAALIACGTTILFWLYGGWTDRDAAKSPRLSVVPAAAVTTPTPAPIGQPQPSESATQPDVDAYIETRIRTAANDPDASLRNVTLAGDAQQVACGEIRKSSSAQFVRFIWMAGPNLLAINDGGGAYAQFALLCDGKGMPAPGAPKK